MAYDEQILGKFLIRRFSEQDGVEFSAENQVSFWFSGRVQFRGDWVPRILFIFEMLVWGHSTSAPKDNFERLMRLSILEGKRS